MFTNFLCPIFCFEIAYSTLHLGKNAAIFIQKQFVA